MLGLAAKKCENKHKSCLIRVLYRSKSAVRLSNKEANICGIAVTVAGIIAGGSSSCCSSSAMAAAATMAAPAETLATIPAVAAAAANKECAGGKANCLRRLIFGKISSIALGKGLDQGQLFSPG